MGKCHPATFSHTNPLDIPEVWTATKLYILMLQTSNLAVLLIFACSFHFWYSQSARSLIDLLVSRSPDQVMRSLLLFISTGCTGERVRKLLCKVLWSPGNCGPEQFVFRHCEVRSQWLSAAAFSSEHCRSSRQMLLLWSTMRFAEWLSTEYSVTLAIVCRWIR